MANFTPADFPYFDASTTVFAVFATYMVTKKVLENWLYWVVIDFLSIYIYIEKGLTPTAVLFALYVVLALYGYIKWQQTYQQQQAVNYA
jgi:nicotinamide mononucleotide transporter